MEQEQIIERLRGEIGETSLSDRTITEYVSLNLPTNGTEPDDAYFTKHAGVLKSLSGNFNHDVSVAVEDFKKKWKPDPKPSPSPDPTPTPKPDPTPNGIEEILKVMQTYQSKVEQLETKLMETEKTKSQEILLSKVKSKMVEQGAKDAYVLDKALANADFGNETDVDALTKRMLEKYDAEYTACRGKGGGSPRNTGNGGGGGASKELDDFFSRKAKREHWDNKKQ